MYYQQHQDHSHMTQMLLNCTVTVVLPTSGIDDPLTRTSLFGCLIRLEKVSATVLFLSIVL